MKNEITEGYKKNAAGHLVPIDQIKPLDILRDELVEELHNSAMEIRKVCEVFKASALKKIDSLVELAAQEHGVVLGGPVGNLTLQSFDGQLKILRAVEKYISFDEQLHVAKALIDECIKEWTTGARSEILALIDGAFRVDSKGKLSVDRILGLRRLNIEDPRWRKAMEAISESIRIDSSKVYLRFYLKNGTEYVQQEVRL
jgi:hypothetical protein